MDDHPMDMDTGPEPHSAPQTRYAPSERGDGSIVQMNDNSQAEMRALVADNVPPSNKFRDITVKVHIRRPDRDAWQYLGRGIVKQEWIWGNSYRVVVKSQSSPEKTIVAFGDDALVQAEKRGNFVVVSCVEGSRVVSWSLNAMNNAETLRLLATIDISCYSVVQAVGNPDMHRTHRRRVARIIKDDRRRRHKRRKDQDSMVAAFARTGLDTNPSPPQSNDGMPEPASMPQPQPVQQGNIHMPQPSFMPQIAVATPQLSATPQDSVSASGSGYTSQGPSPPQDPLPIPTQEPVYIAAPSPVVPQFYHT